MKLKRERSTSLSGSHGLVIRQAQLSPGKRPLESMDAGGHRTEQDALVAERKKSVHLKRKLLRARSVPLAEQAALLTPVKKPGHICGHQRRRLISELNKTDGQMYLIAASGASRCTAGNKACAVLVSESTVPPAPLARVKRW